MTRRDREPSLMWTSFVVEFRADKTLVAGLLLRFSTYSSSSNEGVKRQADKLCTRCCLFGGIDAQPFGLLYSIRGTHNTFILIELGQLPSLIPF